MSMNAIHDQPAAARAPAMQHHAHLAVCLAACLARVATAWRHWVLCLVCCGLAGLAAAPVHAGQGPLQALQQLQQQGDALAEAYAAAPAERAEAAASGYSRLYFDVFEASGLELSLGTRDRGLLTAIEQGFARCIRLALERRPAHELHAAWRSLQADLLRAQAPLAQVQASQGTQAFWQSFLIVLREGAEAILVVSALAAFLRRSGQADRLRWLWAGVVSAALASLLLAWALAGLLAAAGAWRGGLLGALVMLAALMLAQMAAWMAARRSAERWNNALRAHLHGALDGTPVMTAGVAFVAVFREGAETLVFYQALAGAAPGQATPMSAGAVVGAAALCGVYFGLQWLGRRVPFGAFFTATSALLLLMALVFAGKSVLLLQLAGWLPVTDWPGVPQWPWLGLHPNREAVLAQAAVLALVLVWLALASRDSRMRQAAGSTAAGQSA